jgi:hypothetical protein
MPRTLFIMGFKNSLTTGDAFVNIIEVIGMAGTGHDNNIPHPK